jgi:hypothetical protein
VRKIALIGLFFVFSSPLCAAAALPGWAEVIESLATEKSQAEACVGLLKSRADAATLDKAKASYGEAKAQIDGAIAGLLVLLDESGQPSLPDAQARLAASGQGLRRICEAATKDAKPGERGFWDEMAKGAVEPLIKALSDGAGALWAHHVTMDQQERDTRKTQLEAARWPDFASISAR